MRHNGERCVQTCHKQTPRRKQKVMESGQTFSDLSNGSIPEREAARRAEKSADIAAGSSMAGAIGGVAVVVLAILGLAGVGPLYMISIATIVLGVAFLSEGGGIAARHARVLSGSVGGHTAVTEFGGGMTAEFIGGAAGIILGILALIGVVTTVLTAAAAIVFGATLLLSSGVPSHVGAPTTTAEASDSAGQTAREAAYAA